MCETPKLLRPYYGLNEFYQKIFGMKVRKLPLQLATDCPNRRGLRGMRTCVFCDVWGSAAYEELAKKDISYQLDQKIKVLRAKHHNTKFLGYFQSYTTTFLGLSRLQAAVNECLKHEAMIGVVIGTRPDCLSEALLQFLVDLSRTRHVAIELGVQSFVDEHLSFLARGHNASANRQAITRLIQAKTLQVGVHLIFGIPGETDEIIKMTARMLNELQVNDVKLHNLHVLKNTELEQTYLRGQFQPVSLEEYSRRVILFLEHLSPRIAVQRLTAVASRWDELIAPDWTKHHLRSYQFIIDQMVAANTWQGRLA